jgi:cytochrome P450
LWSEPGRLDAPWSSADVDLTEECLVAATALFTSEYWDNAHVVGARLRAEAAASRALLPNGVPVWVVHRYREARACLADPRLSKDAGRISGLLRARMVEAGVEPELSHMFDANLMLSDPPDHDRQRGLVAARFGRDRVEAMAGRVEAITARLLDAVPVGEPVDLIDRVAFALPVAVICELLGVPAADQPRFRDLTADMMGEDPEVTLPASDAMAAYFQELIAAKRAWPGEDLLSALVTAADGENRLTEQELLGTTILLLVAGHETTMNLIGNAVVGLLGSGAWPELVAEPELVRGAVREVLRWDPPVKMAPFRASVAAVELDGTVVPAGELVLVDLLAANRDPDRFERPEELDIRRPAGGHLAFGHGVHHCLGMLLALLEADTVIGQLVVRFPGLRLAGGSDVLRRKPSAIMHGWERVPVVFRG